MSDSFSSPRPIHPFQRLSPHICNNDISSLKKPASHMPRFLLHQDYYYNYDVTHGVRQVIFRLWTSGTVHLLLRPRRRFFEEGWLLLLIRRGGCDNRFDCVDRLSGCFFTVWEVLPFCDFAVFFSASSNIFFIPFSECKERLV